MYNSINAQKDESMIHNKSPKSKQRSSGFTALTKGKVTSSGMSDKKAKGSVDHVMVVHAYGDETRLMNNLVNVGCLAKTYE